MRPITVFISDILREFPSRRGIDEVVRVAALLAAANRTNKAARQPEPTARGVLCEIIKFAFHINVFKRDARNALI